jgi:uroporphyrin-III C-methyltransferase/precorrin-2 dehydrogenase/sirohydrochlorin ferrochelatase
MDFFPLFVSLKDRVCVVVGGGEVAYRKATQLSLAGARLRVIAESHLEKLQKLIKDNEGELITGRFSPSRLEGAALVIAATDDSEVNTQVFNAAQANSTAVNVVDQPELCTFIMPSIVNRNPVLVAISTSGSSPLLAKKLKEQFETMVPARTSDLANLLKQYRGQVKQTIPDQSLRLRFWEELLDSEFSELVYSGNKQKAASLIEQKLAVSDATPVRGEVYLVGAGPGDPDLLTLKALRLMQKADVVLYDRLVSAEIMLKVRADAEKIYVGKAQADHTVDQETINEMLVRLASAGKRVLRLKGGDPFIFGRGGEEIEKLAEHQISFQVVPGITAASGCAAYAGIPLTHRSCSQSVRFLTGHLKDRDSGMDWGLLAKEQQTLVFYMGLSGLKTICEQLQNHGMSGETPIAIVQQGTTPTQRVLTGTLSSMPAQLEIEKFKAPTIIIIGEVVRLREQLAWL